MSPEYRVFRSVHSEGDLGQKRICTCYYAFDIRKCKYNKKGFIEWVSDEPAAFACVPADDDTVGKRMLSYAKMFLDAIRYPTIDLKTLKRLDTKRKARCDDSKLSR